MKRFQLLLVLVVSIILFLHSARFLRPWIPTEVINLDRSPGRMMITKLQAILYGIPVERHPAIDGNAVEFPDEFVDAYFSNENWKRRYVERHKDPKKTNRVMACAVSHFSIWEKFYDAKAAYVFVLEDDLVLEPQHRQKVNAVVNGLNTYDPDWHIVWFSGNHKSTDTNPAFTIPGHTVCHFNNNGGGGGAYLLSQKGLEHFVTILRTQGCHDASDEFLWKHLQVEHSYNVHKPICHFTDAISSTIVMKKA